MKIHGTAKGGALDTKDFGVAFGGAAANGGCSNFEDSLGTDANGVNTGSSINTDDEKLGTGCLSLNAAAGNFVNIDGAEGFSTTVGTISLWINPASATQDDTVLSFADSLGTDYLTLRVENQVLYVEMRISNVKQWAANQTGLDADTWHHCFLVQDGTAVKFYFDNVEQATFTTSTDKSTWLTANIDNARIASIQKNGGANGDFWGGLIDDIGLWDIAIDSTTRDYIWNGGTGRKISQLGTAGTDTTCEGIKAYYNCDEFDDTTLTNNAVPL